jgi:hypothetical protein
MASRWSDVVNRTKTHSNIIEISPAELHDHISGQNPCSSETAPVIIDVRESSELELGRVSRLRKLNDNTKTLFFSMYRDILDTACHFRPKRHPGTPY